MHTSVSYKIGWANEENATSSKVLPLDETTRPMCNRRITESDAKAKN